MKQLTKGELKRITGSNGHDIGGGLMIILGAMGGIAVYDTSILEPILDWIGLPWP